MAEHGESVRASVIRREYKGHLARRQDPVRVVAQVVERRRRRKAEDPEYRDRLREQTRAARVLGAHRASMAVARAIKRGATKARCRRPRPAPWCLPKAPKMWPMQ